MYLIGPLLTIAALAAVALILRRLARRPSPYLLILACVPALAGGAAEGHWPAAVALVAVVAGAVALLGPTRKPGG